MIEVAARTGTPLEVVTGYDWQTLVTFWEVISWQQRPSA